MSESQSRKLDGFEIAVRDALGGVKDLLESGKKLKEIDVSKAGDYKVFPALAIEGSGEWKPSGSEAKIKIGASVGSAYTVRAYNSVDDKDDDGVIVFDNAAFAWLKHELMGSAEAQVEGSVGDGVSFGLGASASGGVRLLDYRRHGANSLAGRAVVANITGARFAFRRPDVLALGPGDALAFIIRARLAFEAKVSASYAMNAGLAALDRVLGVAGVGSLKIGAGASLGVFYSVEDDYRLVFKQGGELAVLAEIKKSQGTEKGIKGNLGVEVGFADPDKLAGVIGAYLGSRLGQPLAKLRSLFESIEKATSLDDLPSPQRQIAERIAERIGLADLQTQFGELKQRLDGLEERLLAQLREALSAKLAVQVTFSYTRIESDEVLLSCEMSESRFKKHHLELLRGNLTPVTDHLARQSSGFKLVKYLHTDQIVEKASFGLTVTIGDWLKFGGAQETETTWKVQHNIHGRVRLSFDGRYGNQVSFTREDDTFGYELGAAMEGFVEQPRGSDFLYRLVLGTAWSSTHKEKSKRRSRFFDKVLDDANVLGAVPVGDNEAVKKDLMALKGGVEAQIELALDDKGVRKLTGIRHAVLEALWPRAMTASLPPVYTVDPKLRGRIDDRSRIYGEAAQTLYDAPSAFDFIPGVDYSASGYTQPEQRRLKEVDEGRVQAQLTFSLRELWKPLRPGFHRQRCRQFHDWLEELDLLRQNAIKRDVLDDFFDGIRSHFRQERTYFRQISNVIVTALREAGAGDCVTATLTVTPESGSAIVFQSPG